MSALRKGSSRGEWTSRDLVGLLRVCAINSPHLGGLGSGGGFLHRIYNLWRHRVRANSRKGSRRNIISHYDLGNDFFKLWLDETMLYSSALWDGATSRLEQAQARKLDRVAELLDLKGGESVLEIGCGWGALAGRLAKSAGRLVGVTLSPSQLGFARDRISAAGLDGGVDLQLQDYRAIEGQYDRVVSIEMIEAVGEAYWPAYFSKIAQVLKPGGKALIQAITLEESRFDVYRARPDFIQRHIFPGGFLPTKTVMREQAARAGLRLAETEFFGLSYARTLAEWRRRFDAAWNEIAAQGFDERFRRLWTYYLCYCEAGFLESATDVGFYLFEKPEAHA